MNSIPEHTDTANSRLGRKGFSLMEMSIAVGVLAILAVVFAPIVSQCIDVMITSKEKDKIIHEARFALNYIDGLLKTNCTHVIRFNSGNTMLLFKEAADAQGSYYTSEINYRDSADPDSSRDELVYIKRRYNASNVLISGPTEYILAKHVTAFSVIGYKAADKDYNGGGLIPMAVIYYYCSDYYPTYPGINYGSDTYCDYPASHCCCADVRSFQIYISIAGDNATNKVELYSRATMLNLQ